MTLALARGPEHSDRQGAGASHPAAARGGALSGHTLRPSNPGGGAEEGVALPQQVRPEADALRRAQQRWLREELVSFSAFVHESSGSARGPGPESSAASPARRGRTASALQPALLTARVPEAFPLFLTSPLPRPPSPGTVSYPVPGGCCSVPAARCPLLRSSSHQVPLQQLPALPEAEATWAQERPPPPILPESSGKCRAG